MKKLVLLGGTGGIGKQLFPLLNEKYNVISLGSNDIDITNFNNVKLYFESICADIVVNLSGKKYDIEMYDINNNNLTEINNMLNVNIQGNIHVLSSCLPYMRNKKWGRIIGISSIFSKINVPKNSIYSASKSFMDKLYCVTNKENIRYGITCNTIQLGFWDGGMCYNVSKEIQEKSKEKIGLKRWGTIKELYNTIDYIIENEYINGTNLEIHGGLY